MTAPTKAAVRKADWDRFKLDGGSLVIYPARKKGVEMVGMARLFVAEKSGDLDAVGEDEALAEKLRKQAHRSRIIRDARQHQVSEWCIAAFGINHATNLEQRGVRMLEEAVELYQAAGGNAEMAHKLVDFIFARPVGKIGREVGGVGITLLALAQAARLSADGCEAAELERVLSKPLEHFTARNEAKNAAGFNVIAPEKAHG